MVDKKYLKQLRKEPDIICQLEFQEISGILSKAKEEFKKEDLLLEFKDVNEEDEIYVLGDIHGSWQSFARILKEIKEYDPKFVISLGDIVDRGPEQFKCLIMMFILKILEPNRFFLLRGNHETQDMNAYYGFIEKFIDKYEEMNKYKEVLSVFEELPYCALINDNILCLHGGIPESKQIIEQLKDLKQRSLDSMILKNVEQSLFQIMWNDPKEMEGYFLESFRGPGIKFFGREAFEEFMEFNGLKRLVRSHECFPEGYRWFFDKRLLSIFSAANYRLGSPNPATYAIIKKGNVRVKSFSLN